MAVDFLNNLLPLLAKKRDEILKRAHQVGEPVFRDEGTFPRDYYSTSIPKKKVKSGITDVGLGIWRGVELQQESKGHLLLQLCSQYKPSDIIPMEKVREALQPGEPDDDGTGKRLQANIYNILAKFEEGDKPFRITR